MGRPRIGIIIGSTREARFGHKPSQWIYELASARGDMDVELLDLRDYPMPFFDEAASNAYVPSVNEVAQRWQQKIGSFDGYIIVTPEYNRSISAVLKNALDYAYPEWGRKAVACVGYGSVGAARAIEHLRTICVELQLAPIRHGVHIAGQAFMAVWREGKDLRDFEYLQTNAQLMLDQLLWWTTALKVAREQDAAAVS